jgi:hypothetical protein
MSATSFVKTVWGLQGVVFAVPLFGRLLEHKSALPFPPMGDNSTFLQFFALLFIAASVLIPYYMPKKTRQRFVVILLFVSFIASVYLYLHMEKEYVVPLSDGTTFVIKGSVRNPKLPQPYASMNDQDLIEYAGARDADLEHAYTRDSLEDNRNKVFGSYVLSLVVFQVMLGYAALTGEIDHPAT